MIRNVFSTPHLFLVPIAVAFLVAVLAFPAARNVQATPESTPGAPLTCEQVTISGTPVASPRATDMHMASPESGSMDMMSDVELDQLYIDMMIPHHASVIALAEVALQRLTDQRLIDIAHAIINAQTSEIDELRGYRAEFYGSSVNLPLDMHLMDTMMGAMPEMGNMNDMMFQMDADAQVSAFCESDNPELAFVSQVIPHHQMAIDSSRSVAESAVHPEIRDFAVRVIADQQTELDVLLVIKADLEASGS